MTSNAVNVGVARAASRERTDVAWPRDYRRILQLLLGLIWLLDGVLQLQPFMFTPGSSGFSGMIAGTAAGNPHWIAHTITWNASLVDHHAVALNTLFALVQIAIGVGIAWRPLLKPALALSIVWSLGVWWFGEGLGGVLHGTGSPFFGGPGAVLFYAILAVLLWPSDLRDEPAPYVAARAIGRRAATIVWFVVWIGLAVLAVIGSGRSTSFLSSGIQTVNSGQPHWLASLDTHTTSFFAHHGSGAAIALAIICLIVATGHCSHRRPCGSSSCSRSSRLRSSGSSPRTSA